MIEDDKNHFDGSALAYNHTTFTLAKHIRNDKWRHISHTMCAVATQILSLLKYEEKCDSSETCINAILFWTTFSDGASTHNLICVSLGHNCGYIFQNKFKTIVGHSSNTYFSFKRSKWVGITYNHVQFIKECCYLPREYPF